MNSLRFHLSKLAILLALALPPAFGCGGDDDGVRGGPDGHPAIDAAVDGSHQVDPPDASVDARVVVPPPPPDASVDAGDVVPPLTPDASVDARVVVPPPPPDASVDAGVVPPPPPDPAVPLSQLGHQLLVALCTKSFECCETSELPQRLGFPGPAPTTVQQCITSGAQYWDNVFAQPRPRSRRGAFGTARITRARACVRALARPARASPIPTWAATRTARPRSRASCRWGAPARRTRASPAPTAPKRAPMPASAPRSRVRARLALRMSAPRATTAPWSCSRPRLARRSRKTARRVRSRASA